MRFVVVQFGGSNCDRDVAYVLNDVCGIDTDLVWYKERLSRAYDAVILPGGFSYGDYLRAGAIAARARIMDDVRRITDRNGLILGICNGAQILAESGLVPGVFTMNAYPKFICRPAYLRVESSKNPFTLLYAGGEVIRIPIAHREGRYIPPSAGNISTLKEGSVAFRFCDPAGNVTPESNPNGSFENITGVLSDGRNVLAMMPHPERASEDILGSSDGKRIFLSMARFIEENS